MSNQKTLQTVLLLQPIDLKRVNLPSKRYQALLSATEIQQKSSDVDHTLNRKFNTSPSFTTYSFPSARILPASLAPCSPLQEMKSS